MNLQWSERSISVVRRRARAFKLDSNKGSIAVGYDADIVLVDPDKEWTISDDIVLSKIGWTPYNGRKCRGQVLRTLVRGTDIYRDGKIVAAPGFGKQATPT